MELGHFCDDSGVFQIEDERVDTLRSGGDDLEIVGPDSSLPPYTVGTLGIFRDGRCAAEQTDLGTKSKTKQRQLWKA